MISSLVRAASRALVAGGLVRVMPFGFLLAASAAACTVAAEPADPGEGASGAPVAGPGAGGAVSEGEGEGEGKGKGEGATPADGGGTDARADGGGGPVVYAVTGRLTTPTCTFDANRGEARCVIPVAGAAVSPALPAGAALRDVVELFAQHGFSPPSAGWTDGLGVTRPVLPPACRTSLQWGDGETLVFKAWSATAAGTPCGLPVVDARTFAASGFAASAPAVRTSDGARARVSFALR